MDLEGVTKVGTDLKWRFVSFKVTPSNDRFLCVYAPSGYSTRKLLARERFFEGLQNYMKNKNERNENKIIFGDFNFTMDKMDRDGENKIQKLYRCCSNYTLSKFIVNLWRREIQEFPELTHYKSSFGKDLG